MPLESTMENEPKNYHFLNLNSCRILKEQYYLPKAQFKSDTYVRNFWKVLWIDHWELRPTVAFAAPTKDGYDHSVVAGFLPSLVPKPVWKFGGSKFFDANVTPDVDWGIVDGVQQNPPALRELSVEGSFLFYDNNNFMLTGMVDLEIVDPFDQFEETTEINLENVNLGFEYIVNEDLVTSLKTTNYMQNIAGSIWTKIPGQEIECTAQFDIPCSAENKANSYGWGFGLKFPLQDWVQAQFGYTNDNLAAEQLVLGKVDFDLSDKMRLSVGGIRRTSNNDIGTNNGRFTPSVRFEMEL